MSNSLPMNMEQCKGDGRSHNSDGIHVWRTPRFMISATWLLAGWATSAATAEIPTPTTMAAAREDAWGEAALRQPGGPTYDFFRSLLPPLRYVNTDFRHYPIVLSAPAAAVKARWISNGSGINLRASKPPMWKEIGEPVQFLVGDELSESFGADLMRLSGPRYVDGYLPIVEAAYALNGATFEQTAFAPVQDDLAQLGAVCVRFTVRGKAGRVAARLPKLDEPGIADGGVVRYVGPWHWNSKMRQLEARLSPDQSADLCVFTKPAPTPSPDFDFAALRTRCAVEWKTLVARGTTCDIPEPVVQNAWRSLVVGNFLIADGDRMNYSAGNAYDHLYESECGDAVRSLLLFGHHDAARRMVQPLLEFDRQATRFHVAGHKLQLLAFYYWVTRDAAYMREKESLWKPVIEFVRTSRTENGLLPRDRYAGDIAEAVYSLNSNSNCWRGLRDMAAVLRDLGDMKYAAELEADAADFRKAILDAVARSERRDTTPPFIPIALLADEPAHDPLTATRNGSYYDLIAPYVLGSDILGAGSERETALINYLRQHGGIAMGMIRSMPHQGEFNQQPGVNVLYGLRYMLTQLRRDETGPALVGFYGHLAQAMTRDTFIGGEGSRFFHGDEHGRSFYLPPNSASNAMFLLTLRYLLIQDWDLNEDGRPETLRIGYAIPQAWLEDGKSIHIERAPSAFGDLSFHIESHLKAGSIAATLSPPPRAPGKWQLRIPAPIGHEVVSARIDSDAVTFGADGSIELTGRTRPTTVQFQVRPRR
jgi:hypothetical protein